MSATLASVQRLLTLLSSRDNTLSVPSTAHDYLVVATSAVERHIGMSLQAGEKVATFDTRASTRAAPGLEVPIFSREPLPYFDLPVRGPLSMLEVRYRGHDDFLGEYDRTFDWANVPLLVPREDYFYDEDTGAVRLLFKPGNYTEGLQIRYGVVRQAIRDIAFGPDLRALLDGTRANAIQGIENPDLAKLFAGVQHKGVAASVEGTGTVVLDLTMPDGADMNEITLHAPNNAAPIPGGAGMVMQVRVQPQGAEPQTWDLTFPGTGPAGSYRLALPPSAPGSTVRLSIIPLVSPDPDNVVQSWSRMDLGYLHPTWTHYDGVVHTDVSQATAMLAARMYLAATTSGVEGGAPVMPADIRDMLIPHLRGTSGVRFI